MKLQVKIGFHQFQIGDVFELRVPYATSLIEKGYCEEYKEKVEKKVVKPKKKRKTKEEKNV